MVASTFPSYFYMDILVVMQTAVVDIARKVFTTHHQVNWTVLTLLHQFYGTVNVAFMSKCHQTNYRKCYALYYTKKLKL